MILNHPDEKLLEDDHMIRNGVLLEWPATAAVSMFQCLDSCVEGTHGEFGEWWEKTAPADQREGDHIVPAYTDPPCSPAFCKELGEDVNVGFGQSSGRK